MGCHYPSCMMGGRGCDYESDCRKEDEERYRRSEEKRLLDLEEQRLRVELMQRKLDALNNEDSKRG